MKKILLIFILFLVAIPGITLCPTQQEEKEHSRIETEFKKILKNYGRKRNEKSQPMRQGKQQGTQTQFNSVRSQLNTLLAKPILTDADLQEIHDKITKLDDYNPARWPQPQDYENLLNFRTSLEGMLKTVEITLNQLARALQTF